MLKRIALWLACTTCLVGPTTAQTWTGAVNGNWATAGNWSSLPANNGVATLVFGASSNTTMNQNLANPFDLYQMTFNAGAPAYTLNGSTIGLQDGGFGLQGTLTQNSSNAVTINAPVNAISLPTIFRGTGSGTVTINGAFSGQLLKQSSCNLVLTNSANSNFASAEVSTGTLIITSPTAGPLVPGGSVQIDTGAVFQLGFTTGGNPTAPLGALNINPGGTFAVPAGNADYYLNSLYTSGIIDLTGSNNFWLHFAGASPTVNIAGTSTWVGSASSRIQNDGTAPLSFGFAAAGAVLTEGIILANGTTSQPIDFYSTGTVVLTNPGNTANFIIDLGAKIQVFNVANLGTGTLTLRYNPQAGNAFESAGALAYTGPTATLTKNITLANGEGNVAGGGGAIGATSLGTILTVSGVIGEASPGQGLGIFGIGTTTSPPIVSLTGTNTYTGPTFVFGGGTVSISSVTNGGTAGPLGAATNSSNNLMLGIPMSGSGTLLYTGASASTDRGITFSITTADAGYVEVATAGTNLTLLGQLTGGMLNKTGPGTLTLVSSNSSIAGANILAGTLVISNPFAMGIGGGAAPPVVNVMANTTFHLGFSFGANPNFPLSTLNLNGGTMNAVAGNGSFYLNQIVSQAGGVIDLSATTNLGIHFISLTGPIAGISVMANATWLGGGSSQILNDTSALLPITISPGVTLSNGIILAPGAASQGFQVTGGGTLNLTGAVIAPLSVSAGSTVQTAAVANLQGIPVLTLDGGTLAYTGPTDTLPTPITLTANGGIINVSSPGTTLQISASLTGSGLFAKEGVGTLALVSANGFTGTMLVDTGVLQLQGGLGGSAAIAVNAAGNLQYASTQTTGRTFNLNYGTLSATSGTTVTLSGATVNGGFMRGSGTFSLTGGAALNGVTIESSAVINQTGAASFANVSNGGPVTIASGLTSTMIGLTNQGSGSITVGQDSQVNVQDFQSYGTLTLNPGSFNGTSGNFTQFVNTGSSKLYFNGGSRTFISTAAQAPNINAGIDLHGFDAEVAGGLLVNNGYVIDSTGTGHRIVADFGAVVKGAGFYQTVPQTINGGTFSTGNSPGGATAGAIVLGGPNDPNLGLSNYTWQINDAGPSSTFPAATGMAGPTPNAAKQVSGWGLLTAVAGTSPVATTGNFQWDATPTDKLTVHLTTLLAPNDVSGNPSAGGGYGTTGDNTAGPMSDFDPTKSYFWPAMRWAGSYTGPADAAVLDAATAFDTSGFLNPVAGTFGWELDAASQMLSIIYTPSAVPEPGTLALLGLPTLVLAVRRRRRGHLAPTA